MADPFAKEDKYLTEDKAREMADLEWSSPFHTVGRGPTQAAAGNHKHTEYVEPTDIVAGANITVEIIEDGKVKITGGEAGGPGGTDHGGLTGLEDDDHPQYFDIYRGDDRYSQQGHGHGEYSVANHTHAYAPSNHTHAYTQCGIRAGKQHVGDVPAGGVVGPFAVAHGLGKTPVAVAANATDDTGSQSVVISIRSWDASVINFLARNLGGANEDFSVSWIAIG